MRVLDPVLRRHGDGRPLWQRHLRHGPQGIHLLRRGLPFPYTDCHNTPLCCLPPRLPARTWLLPLAGCQSHLSPEPADLFRHTLAAVTLVAPTTCFASLEANGTTLYATARDETGAGGGGDKATPAGIRSTTPRQLQHVSRPALPVLLADGPDPRETNNPNPLDNGPCT